jgi:hypothetical protein
MELISSSINDDDMEDGDSAVIGDVYPVEPKNKKIDSRLEL